MRPRRAVAALAATALLAASVTGQAEDAESTRFRDPLDVAAAPSPVVTVTPMIAVASAGPRLVAVGLRGRVLLSDDEGKSWTQAAVPVSSDLVAVHFVDAGQGWAAGHDGVILHTEDGGRTWSRQLDGRTLEALLRRHFEQLVAQGEAGAEAYLEEVGLNFQHGPEQAILGVWFEDALNGFAAGTFGTLLATRDGGRTWESWIERVDNPERLHFYSIHGIGGEVWMSSERGTVFRLDRAQRRFQRMQTGYAGGFFGLIGAADGIIAYGLRGNAYRTRDGGQTWAKIETGVQAGINGASSLEDGRVAFVTQDGRLLVTADGGDSFALSQASRPTQLTGAAATAGGSLVLSGFNGVQIEALR